MHGLPSAAFAERHPRIGIAHRCLLACLTALCLLSASIVHAEGIEARKASIEAQEDGWYADADFEIDFNPVLADAVQRGVALYFVADIEIKRNRWYWLDERVLSAQHSARLSYNALTSQYRVVIGAGPLAQRFDDVSSAVVSMARVRNWRIGDRSALRPGQKYSVQVRMRLDVNQLPKPFQLNAITNREWALASDWYQFDFKP